MRGVMKVKTGVDGFDEIVPGFPRGGIIIVSGSPGTGKTSFAASFIYNGAAKYGEPGVYASLIEDENRFHEYMHSFGYDFVELEKKGMFRYIALPTLLQEGMSASISMVLDVVESIKAKRLVIDSYTALSQMFRSRAEARTFLHTLISRIVKRLECTTILIKEEQAEKKEYGFEDFVADAVIHLKTSRLEDKLLRELTIVKLRGSEVRLPDACFTLHGGFRVIKPLKIKEAKRRYEPPPDPPGGYTSGIPDLDKEIGGFRDGSIILLEIDPKLAPRGEYHLILAPMVVSYVKRGRPCLIVPSGGVSSKDVREIAFRYGVSEEEYRRLVRVVDVERLKPLIARDRATLVEQFTSLLESLEKESGKPPLKLIGMDRAAYLMGEEVLPIIYRAVDELRERGGLAIWVAKPTYPWFVERLAPLADIHLKIMRKHGCMLFYGIKPRTPLYAVQPDPTEETLTPEIIPIT